MKSISSYALIALLIIIVIIIASMFSQNVKIKEYKYFVDRGFMFNYVVFKGWEVLDSRTTSENTLIFLKPTSYIKISKIPALEPGHNLTLKKNPYGVMYDSFDDVVQFYGQAFGVQVELVNISDSPSDFSKEVFWQYVIESFKLTNQLY